MASLQTQTFAPGTNYHNKLSKSRNRTVVKPLLKKLHSHSERNSLDLDRSWEDQTPNASYGSLDSDADSSTLQQPYYSTSASKVGNGRGATTAATAAAAQPIVIGGGGGARSARDVSFTLPTDVNPSSSATRTSFNHARSTSGASHASLATTNSGRNGSFVHPFQQTPRASTPPLSYANSLASLDNGPQAPIDYSPTINEDEDLDPLSTYPSTSAPRSHHPSSVPPSTTSLTNPTSNPYGQSVNNHRASSLSETSQAVRASATRSNSAQHPRISETISEQGRLDLQPTAASSVTCSPVPSTTTGATAPSPPLSSTPPSGSFSHMSPLRTSLEKSGFRIRSRSEVDTLTRKEQVREARRKFEEKEKAKDEKYAREQDRKRERADSKEAQKSERAHSRMSSGGHGRVSTSTNPWRASRKSTELGRYEGVGEKTAMANHGYDWTPSFNAPNAKAEDVRFGPATRKKTAKRTTTSAWTAFVLWFRTRLLKLGRR